MTPWKKRVGKQHADEVVEYQDESAACNAQTSRSSTKANQSTICPTRLCIALRYRTSHIVDEVHPSRPKNLPQKKMVRFASLSCVDSSKYREAEHMRKATSSSSPREAQRMSRLHGKRSIGDLRRRAQSLGISNFAADLKKAVSLDVTTRKLSPDRDMGALSVPLYTPEITNTSVVDCDAVSSHTHFGSHRLSSADQSKLPSHNSRRSYNITSHSIQCGSAIPEFDEHQPSRGLACIDGETKWPTMVPPHKIFRGDSRNAAQPPRHSLQLKPTKGRGPLPQVTYAPESTYKSSGQKAQSFSTLHGQSNESPSDPPPQNTLPDLVAGPTMASTLPQKVSNSATKRFKNTERLSPLSKIVVSNDDESLRGEKSFRKSSIDSHDSTTSKTVSMLCCSLKTARTTDSNAFVGALPSGMERSPYARHDISSFRAERSRYRKSLYQENRDRERSTAAAQILEPAEAILEDVVPSRLSSLNIKRPKDKLECWSPVSKSFDHSLAGVRYPRSWAQTLEQQFSCAPVDNGDAAVLTQQPPLDRSGIKILGDRITGSDHSRAGAQSILRRKSSTQDGSQINFNSSTHQVSLQDHINNAKLVGKRSIGTKSKSHDLVGKARSIDKSSLPGSVHSELNDQTLANLSPGPTGNKPNQKFRRQLWDDVHAAQVHYPRVEEYYGFIIARLETELSEQHEKIEMLAKVLMA